MSKKKGTSQLQPVDGKQARIEAEKQAAAARYALLQAQSQERYRLKSVRREIVRRFEALQRSGEIPNLTQIKEFLLPYITELPLVREALAQTRAFGDRWSTSVWELLSQSDQQLVDILTEKLKERQFAIQQTKLLIQHKLPQPLVIRFPTTTDGPGLYPIDGQMINSQVRAAIGEDYATFTVNGPLPIARLGTALVELRFDNGDIFPLTIHLELEADDLPEDFRRKYETLESAALPEQSNLTQYIEAELALNLSDAEGEQRYSKLLKLAYQLGYWKTKAVQRLLNKWRALHNKIRAAQESTLAGIADDNLRFEGLQTVDIEKLKVLNLPPLVCYDLIHAPADVNPLKNLSVLPEYRAWKTKTLEDISHRDLRNIASASREIASQLKSNKFGQSINPRAIAKILLTVARLQFERLEIGTYEASLRMCLSNYCLRMGEYLVQQHRRFDLARDYYLESVTLNLTLKRGREFVEFPIKLLFRSFADAENVPSPIGGDSSPAVFLRLLDEPGWQRPEIHHTAIRAFLEMGVRHYHVAWRWFNECSETTQQQLLDPARYVLGLGPLADLSDCVRVYEQYFNQFQTVLRQMRDCMSLHEIVQTMQSFTESVKQLDFLLSSTNREILSLIIQAGDSISRFLRSPAYEEQRAIAVSAIQKFDRALSYGADNYTALWAEHSATIARRWRQIIHEEIEERSKDIAPNLIIEVAESHISLNATDGNNQQRVIFGVRNIGVGRASRVNIVFQSNSGETFFPKHNVFDLESQEYIEDDVNIGVQTRPTGLELSCKLAFYGPDQKRHERSSIIPLRWLPLVDAKELTELAHRNPFKSDKEVEDEQMFVGRDTILEEVSLHAMNSPSGSLLMLFGQKRVGKSSLLLFLEREFDRNTSAKNILGVRVTWLDYTKHSAPDLMHEIALEIRDKYRRQVGQTIGVPSRTEFRESYTVAFNDTLRNLRETGMKRLILMWDEFDGLVNHFENPQMEFDRVFFEYLRGLSKRRDISIILTGGELMPILFERWGEVFNHDRTWRVSYLSPYDGSVEKLVHNQYLQGILNFGTIAVDQIKRLSACNPYFVQMLCENLVSRSQHQQSAFICCLDVNEVAKWLVQHRLDPKSMRHLYAPKLQPDYLDMAVISVTAELEMRSGRSRFVSEQSIAAQLINRYQDEAINRVGELVRREILQRNPENKSEVRTMLPLFRDWFVENKPEYNNWISFLRR